MKKKELLIILILAALITYLYFWWQVSISVWDFYGRAYPGPLYPFSFFKWWYPAGIFIKTFVVLVGGWWVAKVVLKRVKKK